MTNVHGFNKIVDGTSAQLDIRTPYIDNILSTYKNRFKLKSLKNDNDNDNDDRHNLVSSITVDVANNDISSVAFNQLPVSKQSHILFNDSTNSKVLKSIQRRYQLMTSKVKCKDDDKAKDIAKKYMQLANNNDINSIISMMTTDAVCYGNVGIDNIEKGMIAFHNSLKHPFWKINGLNIITKDQMQCIDAFKSSHICHRNDLKYIEVKFTRYWTVDSIIEIANAIEIISVNANYKIVSIMYSQLPIKEASDISNKYPDEYSTIELNKNDNVNVVSDGDSNSSGIVNEWYEYFTDEGVPYYYNVLTNESSWDVPTGINTHVYKQYQDDNENWYFLCDETGVSLWVT